MLRRRGSRCLCLGRGVVYSVGAIAVLLVW